MTSNIKLTQKEEAMIKLFRESNVTPEKALESVLEVLNLDEEYLARNESKGSARYKELVENLKTLQKGQEEFEKNFPEDTSPMSE